MLLALAFPLTTLLPCQAAGVALAPVVAPRVVGSAAGGLSNGAGRSASGGSAAGSGSGSRVQPVDVNAASAAELERVRGIGPAMAARIVSARKTGGRFRDGDDLRRRVRGIGEATLRRMTAAGLVIGGAARVEPVRAAARDRVDLVVGNSPAKAEQRGLGRIDEIGCCAAQQPGARGEVGLSTPPGDVGDLAVATDRPPTPRTQSRAKR